MTHRGLFFCANETCYLAPEIWRGKIGNRLGLCAEHALTIGWIDKIPEPVQQSKPAGNRKSFLTRLLEGEANGTTGSVLDASFPCDDKQIFPTHEPTQHWSEYRDYPF